MNGFVFNGKLELEFTLYGQIEKGASVFLRKGSQLYRLTIRPVTGFASLIKE